MVRFRHKPVGNIAAVLRLNPLKCFKANVNTLTPLASAFDKQIPSLSLGDRERKSEVGLFGVPQLTSSDGFYELKEDVLNKANGLVTRIVSTTHPADVVAGFDELSNELCKVADLAEFVRLSHPDQRFAKAAEHASFEIGGFVEKLNTHYELYSALKNSMSSSSPEIDSVTKIVADLFLFDFEQSGIHLAQDKQKLAVELHQAALMVGAEFVNNANISRNYPLDLWPKDLPIPYAMEGNEIIVDSTYSTSTNDKLREASYKAYMSSCKQQLTLFDSLLFIRDQLSTLLGFKSFAERTLKGTMASSPDNVNAFLEKTLDMLQEPLENDVKSLKEFQRSYHGDQSGVLKPWDVKMYTNLMTSQMYNLSSWKLSEYFSVGACMNGLNLVFSSLYGVSLKAVDSGHGEVWAPDVQKLQVCHETEGTLGYIYCDFFQRQGKLPQDCHFTIRGGKLLEDGSYQLPIVCLICNFPNPSKETPSLLTQNMVENLFHEMGHAMHSMLGRARYQHVTGTRCPTDFAEVPSILMEYFAMDPRILPLYAKHYKTGQPLPEEIITGMIKSKKQFLSIDLQTQTFFSLVDQKLYGIHPLGKPTTDVLNDLHRQYRPITQAVDTSWHLRFSHFHSYAARYYSYVWSKAVASRVWYDCFYNDPLSRGAGERYRETMLKHGGGVPPQTMVENMLNRKVSINDLVTSLHEDLKK